MLKDNLITLRNMNSYSQEQVSEKIGISRQAYAKWEKGDTVPDIEKCALLARLYSVTVDALIRDINTDSLLGPARPMGKHIWGSVSMNDRGQIVIPKAARDQFHLSGGSRLIVLGDEDEGIALIPAEMFEKRMQRIAQLAAIEE